MISTERILELQNLAARIDDCVTRGGTVTLNQADCKAIQEALIGYALSKLVRPKPGPKANGKAKSAKVRMAEKRARDKAGS